MQEPDFESASVLDGDLVIEEPWSYLFWGKFGLTHDANEGLHFHRLR